MKYYKYLVVIACLGIIISSFLPWTYYSDINEIFTGFYSKDNLLGRPGYVLIFLGLVSVIFAFIDKTIAKHIGLGIAAVNLAYLIRTYVSFTGCYLGTCPVKLYGLYLIIIFSVLLMISALLPDLKVPLKKETEDE